MHSVFKIRDKIAARTVRVWKELTRRDQAQERNQCSRGIDAVASR